MAPVAGAQAEGPAASPVKADWGTKMRMEHQYSRLDQEALDEMIHLR